MTKTFEPGQVCTYWSNPAANKRPAVRFLGWFDKEHTYVRVEFLMTGNKVAVPAQYLHAA